MSEVQYYKLVFQHFNTVCPTQQTDSTRATALQTTKHSKRSEMHAESCQNYAGLCGKQAPKPLLITPYLILISMGLFSRLPSS